MSPRPNRTSAIAKAAKPFINMYMDSPIPIIKEEITNENFLETLSAIEPVGTSKSTTETAEIDCKSMISE